MGHDNCQNCSHTYFVTLLHVGFPFETCCGVPWSHSPRITCIHSTRLHSTHYPSGTSLDYISIHIHTYILRNKHAIYPKKIKYSVHNPTTYRSFSTQQNETTKARLSPQQRPPHLGYLAHGHRDMISTQGGPRFHLSTTKGAQGQGEIILEAAMADPPRSCDWLTYLFYEGLGFLRGKNLSNIHPIRLWGS